MDDSDFWDARFDHALSGRLMSFSPALARCRPGTGGGSDENGSRPRASRPRFRPHDYYTLKRNSTTSPSRIT
jgi:hypothetical protein